MRELNESVEDRIGNHPPPITADLVLRESTAARPL